MDTSQLYSYSLKLLIHLIPSISEEVKSLNTEVYFSGQIKKLDQKSKPCFYGNQKKWIFMKWLFDSDPTMKV